MRGLLEELRLGVFSDAPLRLLFPSTRLSIKNKTHHINETNLDPSAHVIQELTQADVRGLGQGGGGLVGAQAVLLPQLVALLQRQDDSLPIVPLSLTIFLHAVKQLLALSFMAPHNT